MWLTSRLELLLSLLCLPLTLDDPVRVVYERGLATPTRSMHMVDAAAPIYLEAVPRG